MTNLLEKVLYDDVRIITLNRDYSLEKDKLERRDYITTVKRVFHNYCLRDLIHDWKKIYRRIQPSRQLFPFVVFGLAGIRHTLKKNLEKVLEKYQSK